MRAWERPRGRGPGALGHLRVSGGALGVTGPMGAWRDWYHVDGHTYGTWLPGDPRGWRAKKHRRHVDGDYRDPPPAGTGEALLQRSRRLLKHPPVRLDASQRECAGRALVEMLIRQEVELLVLSIDAMHYHLLGRFRDGQVRRGVGRAKKHAWHRLRERRQIGKVWQKLCHVTAIADRAHQVNAFRYIRSHGRKGAWVWMFRQGVYWHDPPKRIEE